MTDSGNEIKYDAENKPAISNLLTHLQPVFRKINLSELEKEYAGKNYSIFKKELAEAIIKGLSPIQKKYKELSANPDYVKSILRQGAEKAKAIASQTMAEVRSKIGFLEL